MVRGSLLARPECAFTPEGEIARLASDTRATFQGQLDPAEHVVRTRVHGPPTSTSRKRVLYATGELMMMADSRTDWKC
jgi:hypothetical protein